MSMEGEEGKASYCFIQMAARLIARQRTFIDPDDRPRNDRWDEYMNFRPQWDRWEAPPPATARKFL